MKTYSAGAFEDYIPDINSNVTWLNNSYLSIESSGFRQLTKDDSASISQKRIRDDYLIIYIQKGKLWVETKNGEIPYSEGNILIYTPQMEQNFKYPKEDITETYWVHFCGDGTEEFLKHHNFSEKLNYNVGFENSYSLLFEKIISALRIKEPFFQLAAHSYFTELLYLMAKNHYQLSEKNFQNELGSLQQAVNKMNVEYYGNYPIKHYADICNLSVGRFISNFKKIMRVSPIEYIKIIRINRARELLRDTSYPISNISRRVGYANPLYFSRVFKKVAGISPKYYRNNIISKTIEKD